jgi:hypothetical protein
VAKQVGLFKQPGPNFLELMKPPELHTQQDLRQTICCLCVPLTNAFNAVLCSCGADKIVPEYTWCCSCICNALELSVQRFDIYFALKRMCICGYLFEVQ